VSTLQDTGRGGQSPSVADEGDEFAGAIHVPYQVQHRLASAQAVGSIAARNGEDVQVAHPGRLFAVWRLRLSDRGLHGLKSHGLDQVLVDSGIAGPPAVLLAAVSG